MSEHQVENAGARTDATPSSETEFPNDGNPSNEADFPTPPKDANPSSETDFPNPPTDAVSCRLIRPDGTEWVVTGLDLSNGGPKVEARRANGAPGADTHGAPGAETHGAPEARVLRDEPLRHGDRLVWLDEEGEVVWALKNPVGSGPSERQADNGRFFGDPFLGGPRA